MHIVLVSRFSGHGGVAVYNRTLANALAAAGHQVSLITSRRNPDQPVREEVNGYHIFRLSVPREERLRRLPFFGRYTRSLSQLIYSFRVAGQIRFLEHHSRPDVIEFADVEAEGYIYLRKQTRCPVVVRCHTPVFVLRQYHARQEMPYDTRFTAAMEKFCIRHADALTAPSQHMAQVIARECNIPAERIWVIPNPLDVAQFRDTTRPGAMRQDRSEVIVLHVGRLERIKGIEVLAQAIPEVLRQTPQVRFVFVGAARSNMKAVQWRARLEKAGGSRVSVLGLLEQSELVAWYHRADIAVVPTLNYESFSYTCAQAMAAKLPVVASRVGGIPETVGDGVSGILVEPGKPSAFARAIVELVQNRELREKMGRAGGQQSKAYFDSPVLAKQMLSIYYRTKKEYVCNMDIVVSH